MILDGGLATELETQGHNIDGDLWSASLLQSNPRAIVDAHRAYLDAGADCVISASYQASRMGFAKLGLTNKEADRLIAESVSHARTARDEYLAVQGNEKKSVLVAASIGPYGAALADGSEYTGNYGVSKQTLRDFHEPRLALLDKSRADILACETIPDIGEAQVLRDLLHNTETPAWVSFSCKDEQRICDGTLLKDACQLFADHPGVFAVGINCTPPQFIGELISAARSAVADKAIIVYPNSGEHYHPEENRWSGTACTGFDVEDWQQAGATMIGGCCRTGPDDISGIKKRLVT